jgi:predicted sugar kinase
MRLNNCAEGIDELRRKLSLKEASAISAGDSEQQQELITQIGDLRKLISNCEHLFENRRYKELSEDLMDHGIVVPASSSGPTTDLSADWLPEQ